MDNKISPVTAQSIVETVKELCDHDTNFIDTAGYILASTNKKRIGDFHEIGRKVAEKGEGIEVFANDSFWGTQPGINAPVFHEGRICAVIGITGEPDSIRKYSEIAVRITNLIIRENELLSRGRGRQTANNYVIRTLINGDPMNMDYFYDFALRNRLETTDFYRTGIVQMNARYNPANLSFLDKDIFDTFEKVSPSVYRFQYPNEYVIIFKASNLKAVLKEFRLLAEKYAEFMRIGIGSEDLIFQQNKSYKDAKLSIKSNGGKDLVALYDTYDLEILLGSLEESAAKRFLTKTVGNLSRSDKDLLNIYFETDLSLKETSEKLFIHKNTLQYRLDKIFEQGSYNPRNFKDAVLIYLALEYEKMLDREENK